jgi:hypothetical protein
MTQRASKTIELQQKKKTKEIEKESEIRHKSTFVP